MSASNRAIVQRIFDGLNSHDVTVMMGLYSDAVCHFPLVGELKGEAVRRFYASLLSAFADSQRKVEDQFTDENQMVVTRWTVTGTHLGYFMGIAPTGNRLTVTGISIHRIASGKIVEEWQEWDTLGMMQQLGVVPTFNFEARAA